MIRHEVLKKWLRRSSSRCLLQHSPLVLLFFLNITLLGTICSAEIISNSNTNTDGNYHHNGQSKTVKTTSSAVVSASFPVKKPDHIEGSGSKDSMMEWSDDEDFGAEGSGSHIEGSGDADTEVVQDQALVPVTTSEGVRHTTIHINSSTFEEPSLETRPSTRPPVIAKPPAADSTHRSTLSVLSAFIAVLLVPMLLH